MESASQQAIRADLWIVCPSLKPISSWIDKIMQQLSARKEITFRAIIFSSFVLGFEKGKPVLFIDGERCDDSSLPKIAFIHMPSSVISNGRLTCIRHLEALGIRCINSSEAFSNTFSKYAQMRVLATLRKDNGLSVKLADTLTHSTVIREGLPNMLKVSEFTQFPAILKHVHGIRGRRVMLLENTEIAEDLAENLYDDGMYLLQQYIHECRATHYRTMVIGNRVAGFFKYSNENSGRVQSNLFQGGSREELQVNELLEQQAVGIVKALGMDIAGIDFLKDRDNNYVFMEANGSAAVSNHDRVINCLIDYFIKCCQEENLK